LIVAVVAGGCVHMVKTDLDTYLTNKGEFRGKQVVLETDLQDLLERYDIYRGKTVELTAPVSYCGSWHFWTWHIILEEGDTMIRAYESEYRIYPDRRAVFLMRAAGREKGSVTIQGKVERNGIELNRIYYKDLAVNTNIKMDSDYFLYYLN
jgi:hypothetical protein